MLIMLIMVIMVIMVIMAIAASILTKKIRPWTFLASCSVTGADLFRAP